MWPNFSLIFVYVCCARIWVQWSKVQNRFMICAPYLGARERESLCYTFLHYHKSIILYKQVNFPSFFQYGVPLAFPSTLSNTQFRVSIFYSPNHHIGQIIYLFKALTKENNNLFLSSLFYKMGLKLNNGQNDNISLKFSTNNF